MRVLVITNNGNGLYSFRFELIKAMRDEGHQVVLAYPDGVRKSEFAEIGCRYIDVPFDSSSTNPIGDISLYRRLKKMIKAVRPDVALLYTIKPCIYAGYILKKMHIPYISTVTGISPALISDRFAVRFVAKYLSRIGYKGAATVFFQNRMNEKLYTEMKIALGKHEMIAGSGVNLDKFGYIGYPKDDGEIKLLYLGFLKKIKGVEELSFAVRKAVERGMRVRCRFVGEKWDDLKEYEKSLDGGFVEYEEETDDVRPHLEWCDALVLPSYGEGMSNVLQEASASGRPVLGSNIPGCQEIFDEGETGFGFEPKSAKSLYSAIKRLYETPYESRKQMGIKAREKMMREFDRNKVVETYMAAIDSITYE